MSVQINDTVIEKIKAFILENSVPQSLILYMAGEQEDPSKPFYEVAAQGLISSEIEELQQKIDIQDFDGKKVSILDLNAMEEAARKVMEEEGMLLFGNP